ncbi:MAG: hypothetical protein ACRDYU_15310 [Actinomycetes bacterium]
MRKFTKKSVAVTGAVALAVASAGVAFAYWTAGGSGTGTGDTSAGASNLAVAQTTELTEMFPGDSPQTLSGTVTNNAANSAYVTTVTASLASVSGGGPGCGVSDYTLTGDVMPIGEDIASGGTETFSGATVQFNNKLTNQDDCKSATLHLSYLAE